MSVRGEPVYTLYSVGSGYVFRFHGLCEFHVSGTGDTVSCIPGPKCDEGFLHVLLGGAVTALLSVLRGYAVLHATAIKSDDETVLFTGPSGMGKTTSAALCCAAGARFISDDVVNLERGADGTACVGLGSELRLREQATSIADLFPPPPLERRMTADGRLALKPPRPHQERNMVTAVALPRPVRGPEHVSVHRLRPTEAVAALLGNARIPDMVPPRWQRAHFEAVANLAAEVPVLEVRVPWGPPFSAAVAAEVLGCVCEAARDVTAVRN
jgi:hypothetical protein